MDGEYARIFGSIGGAGFEEANEEGGDGDGRAGGHKIFESAAPAWRETGDSEAWAAFAEGEFWMVLLGGGSSDGVDL